MQPALKERDVIYAVALPGSSPAKESKPHGRLLLAPGHGGWGVTERPEQTEGVARTPSSGYGPPC